MGGRLKLVLLVAALMALLVPMTASAAPPSTTQHARLLVTGLDGGFGSTVGPDGALYVTEPGAARIVRVDPRTGAVTTFAEGLPEQVLPGLGGVLDVAFIGKTAYALVSFVGTDVGGTATVGIYRVDGPHSFSVVADIGTFNVSHPPDTDFFAAQGVQTSFQRFRGGFLVTDGHLNRVLRVTLGGDITVLRAFDNIVPTGLEVRHHRIYMSEAGPVPHRPRDGKIVSFGVKSERAREVASGGRLLVDVEQCSGRHLYALAQGVFPVGSDPGTPALPDTGKLLKVNRNGTFTVVARGLDRPTSLDFIHDNAYITTLSGQVWKIDDVRGCGREHGCS
jgi:hypothetical protein